MAQNQPPAWPKAYSVQGALFIPFAGNNKILLLIILNKTIFIYLFFFSIFITLPQILSFVEIHEPFQAYIDTDNGNSRIDYYDGMDKTYQLKNQGSYGLMLKVIQFLFAISIVR